jgi:hypothetical protein
VSPKIAGPATAAAPLYNSVMTLSKVLSGSLLAAILGGTASGQQAPSNVMAKGTLTSGFDMGVASSSGNPNWVAKEKDTDYFRLAYPAGQTWGAVFVTVGLPRDGNRPFRDMSAFDTIAFELKGGRGGETIDVGIKTNTQLDNGSETKVPLKLTADWQVYEVSLSRFTGADPAKLYVVGEVVFSGEEASTVYLRSIGYKKTAK